MFLKVVTIVAIKVLQYAIMMQAEFPMQWLHTFENMRMIFVL